MNIQITSDHRARKEFHEGFSGSAASKATDQTRAERKIHTQYEKQESKNGPKTQSEPPLVREDGKKDETRNGEGAVGRKFHSSISELFGGFGRTFVQVRVLQTSNTN